MQVDLIIRKQNDSNAYTITCDLAERLVFGRSIGSPVNLAGTEISREHFALFFRKGEICVEDLSSNGTVVNGKPVVQKKAQKISSGDVISVPGYEIEVRKPVLAPLNPRQHALVSPPLEKAVSHFWESFTVWEIIVIAAAIGSFALIIFYFLR